ncbi:hypothetical protein G6F55_014064 [Rhizopus delemar]|nr:hypothetical protein G6F55_014064 [Rhizopus delemar]KAG1533562.1 hypothetical protein G6F49_013510 [Rhizopus delemar]KAG1577755.1 hypothetical protein G6F47_013007 [Rhizopus delemar]KAG1610982.1 hypothetical protein G6F44_013518 [Rhizopus delemar]
MYSSSPYKFHCYCAQCSGGEAGKYQFVTQWTLARHRKKEAVKGESEIIPEVNTNNEVIPSSENDSENNGDEDDASSCMDIVEFNVPKGKNLLELF